MKKIYLSVAVLMIGSFAFGRGTPVKTPTQPGDAVTLAYLETNEVTVASALSARLDDLEKISTGRMMPMHIFAGQSNMEANPKETGYGSLSASLQGTRIPGTYWSAYLSQHSIFNTWDVFGVGAISSTVWGPYVPFADAVMGTVDKAVFVTVAHGGTGLDDWTDSGDIAMYTELITYTDAAIQETLAMGYTPVIYSFNFMQGETDCIASNLANAYYENFLLMIGNFKAEYAQYLDDSFIVNVGRISSGAPGVASRSYFSTVKNFQTQLGAEYSWIETINTDDLSAGIDTIHFDGNSLVTLGDRFFFKRC